MNKQTLYLKSQDEFYIIPPESTVKFPPISDENMIATVYIDLNIHQMFRKITAGTPNETVLQDRLANFTKKIAFFCLNINNSILPYNEIAYLLKNIKNDLKDLKMCVKHNFQTNEEEKSFLNNLITAEENLDFISKEHKTDKNKNQTILNNIKEIEKIHDYLVNKLCFFIKGQVSKDFSKIKNNFDFHNLDIVFDCILKDYQKIKIECPHAALEHEMNSEDKCNYPQILLKKSNSEKICRQGNSEYWDSLKMETFLNVIRGSEMDFFDHNKDPYYHYFYSIYCLYTFNDVLNLFISKKTNELNEISTASSTIASKIIIDHVYFLNANKGKGFPYDIKFEGIDAKKFEIALSPKEKDKKFKNTVFDMCDIYYSLLPHKNVVGTPFYLSKDNGTCLSSIYNVYYHNEKFKIRKNEGEHLTTIEDENLIENFFIKILNNGFPKIYKNFEIVNEKYKYEPNIYFLNKLLNCNTKIDLIDTIMKEYIDPNLIQNEVCTLSLSSKKIFDTFFSDEQYLKVNKSLESLKSSLDGLTYEKHPHNFLFTSKTRNSYIDNSLIPQICGIYLESVKRSLAQKMQSKLEELYSMYGN